MEASKVIPPHCDDGVQSKKQYAPIIIQCVNALVDKGKHIEFSIIHDKVITLIFPINHVHLNLEYFPILIVQMFDQKHLRIFSKTAIMWLELISLPTALRALICVKAQCNTQYYIQGCRVIE